MHRDYNVIVVGAGIAGLMTAVRLAMAGKKVALFDRGLIGSQSTTSNHGMIHSGALYAKDHPEIAPLCGEAVGLFSAAFPDALIARGAYYFGHRACLENHAVFCERLHCPFRWVPRAEVEHLFHGDRIADLVFGFVGDLAVSSRRIVLDLLCLCWQLGIDVHPRASVKDILVDRGHTVGVALAGEGEVSADAVVICAGLGIRELAQRRSLRMLERLKSRLDMMVAFKGSGFPRSMVGLEYGGPAVAPTADGTILASLHGGAQPWVKDMRRWSVPVAKVLDLIERMRFYFRDGLVDYDSGHAYMCSKTELATGNADLWGIEPRVAIVDHGREDGIAHLWTLMPGKMTLGFHASRDLASRLLDAPVDLPLPRSPSDRLAEAETWVDSCPWKALDA